MEQRDWLYLLPSGETAENMIEARDKIGNGNGFRLGNQAFRFLVKNHSVIKINRITHSAILQSDASNEKTSPTQ